MSNTMHTTGERHMQTVYHNGKPVRMWPVDARYALSFPEEYSMTPPSKKEAQASSDEPVMPEVPAALQGPISDPDSVTMDQLRDALRAAGESFRGNASKADLITQWNALASASA